MITGTVDLNLDAIIPLTVRDATNQWISLDVVIDSGLAGEIVLPLATIQSLGLSFLCQNQTMLADGSTCVVDLYEASVDWDGQYRTLSVMAVGPFSLVGMKVLEGFKVGIDVKPGGAVAIEALP